MTRNTPHRPTRGPVSKYDPENFPREAKFLAARGATQAEIAECFGISYRQFKVWLTQYPELYQAVQEGNDAFTPRVERALAERAIGYDYTWEEEEINPVTGQPRTVIKRKHFPPDTKAGIFWLTNRMPDKWRRVQKHEVEVKRRSSDEILRDIYTRIQDLQAKGYLQSVVVPALPMRKRDGHG